MNQPYRVKGSSIRSKLDFVHEELGAEAEQRLHDRFAQVQDLESILDSAWYPFELYDGVNRAIADLFFGGDLSQLERVGAFSAEKALSSVYGAFVAGGDFVSFLNRAALLHQRFYDVGTTEVTIGEDRKSATIVHREAPTYSRADLFVASGFYKGAGRKLGLDEVRSEFTFDETGARFELSWD